MSIVLSPPQHKTNPPSPLPLQMHRALTLHLHAMSAAIPLALSLALSIRDAIPGGEKVVEMDVRTGSIEVRDEITPGDEVCFFLFFWLSCFVTSCVCFLTRGQTD